MADLNELLGKAQEMQGRLLQLQRDLARRTVEASAGGGMVSVVVTGDLRVLEVRIEPDVLAEGDREMLQDLVAAAVNAGIQKAQQMVQEELQKASGLPIGATGGLPGPLGGSGGGTGGA